MMNEHDLNKWIEENKKKILALQEKFDNSNNVTSSCEYRKDQVNIEIENLILAKVLKDK